MRTASMIKSEIQMVTGIPRNAISISRKDNWLTIKPDAHFCDSDNVSSLQRFVIDRFVKFDVDFHEDDNGHRYLNVRIVKRNGMRIDTPYRMTSREFERRLALQSGTTRWLEYCQENAAELRQLSSVIDWRKEGF